MTGSADHRLLLPAVMLTGSCVALLCNLISLLPGASGVIPLNAIHSAGRRSGGYLCDREPETDAIFQLMERRCVITGERLSIGYRLGGRGVRRVHEGCRFRCVPGELTCLLGPRRRR